MAGSDEIQKRQNEDRMLRYQYAARWHYNRAEIQNNLVWVCCILAWGTVFFQSLSVWCAAIAFIMDMGGAIFNWGMSKDVALASDFRKCFDSNVFKISPVQFRPLEKQKIDERAIKLVKQYPQKAKVQMSNTGHDNPPGVRNWYEFSRPLPEADAVFECQRQNAWWSKKITRRRLLRTSLGVLLFGPVFIALLVFVNTNVLLIVFSSAGLVLKCVERLVQNGRYYWLSSKIDGSMEVLSYNRSLENIECLQSYIDKRRAMPVLERNRIHKRHAKEYSELYRETKEQESDF